MKVKHAPSSSWPLATNTNGFCLSLYLSRTIGFQAWRLLVSGRLVVQYSSLIFGNFYVLPKLPEDSRSGAPYDSPVLGKEVPGSDGFSPA